jgi:hypothetical protein
MDEHVSKPVRLDDIRKLLDQIRTGSLGAGRD